MLSRAMDVAAPTLIELLRSRDAEATSRFVRENAGWMLALARRYLDDEGQAEDCVQESFCSAFRAIDRFEGRCELRSWLHRIVINAAMMRLRARASRPEEDLDAAVGHDEAAAKLECHPDCASPEDALLRSELRRQITAMIGELAENYRVVLMLRDIEGMGTQDVARLLGVSESTVKVRLHRARLALRKLLEPLLAGELKRCARSR